jgi:hypothetical protein
LKDGLFLADVQPRRGRVDWGGEIEQKENI